MSMNHDELLTRRAALKKRRARGENVKELWRTNERLIRESRLARKGVQKPARKRSRRPVDEAVSRALTEQGTLPLEPEPSAPAESQEDREKRISTRFRTLDRMAARITENKIPALIISGPPGLGKSYSLEKKAEEYDGTDKGVSIISGSVSAPGLLIALYERKDGGTVVLDDCDDVFRDETTLNILKAVLDSSAKRIVSYRKLAKWMEEMDIPPSFEYRGSVAFCTNIDFEREIERGNRMSTHFKALIDRSLYLTLTLRDKQDFLTRIRQVAIDDKLLQGMGLTEEQASEVLTFIEQNADRCYSLSIRLAMQVAQCMIAEPETWREDANATQLRTLRV